MNPDETHELNRQKVLGRPYQATSVDELSPKRAVYGTRSNELLDPQLAGKAVQRSLPCCVGKKRYLWFNDRLCDEAPRQYEAHEGQAREEQVRGCRGGKRRQQRRGRQNASFAMRESVYRAVWHSTTLWRRSLARLWQHCHQMACWSEMSASSC